MRSFRHLAVLGAASGVVSLVVLVTDAPRLWLAAGPAALAVLDAAVLWGLTRAAVRKALKVEVTLPRVRGFVLILDVLVGASLAILASTLTLSPAPRIVLTTVGVAALVAALGGLIVRVYSLDLRMSSPAFRMFPPASVLVAAEDLGRLKRLLSAGTPFPLAAFAVAPECSDLLDRWLLRGRARVLAGQHDILEGRPYCDIALAGPGRRVVLADAETLDVLLSLLEGDTTREFSVSVGTATYPRDGESLDPLINKAFAVAEPLGAGL